MFNNLSMVTKILGGVTVLGLVATVVSAVVDHRGAAEECCCEDGLCDCDELADPTTEI